MTQPSESSRHWWVLVGTCLGLFILMLDSTVVALALPTIERDLHAFADNVQWVLNGYLLVISVTVVTAGRLGDIYGRRRGLRATRLGNQLLDKETEGQSWRSSTPCQGPTSPRTACRDNEIWLRSGLRAESGPAYDRRATGGVGGQNFR